MKYINNIALFDTINHPTPILKEWGIGLIDLGYQITYYPIEYHNILACMNNNYDLIIYAGNLDYNNFYEFKNKNPNTIIICAANEYINYSIYKNIVDFFINIHNSNLKLKNYVNTEGFQLYQIPLAGNDYLFYPINTEIIYDMCFIGTLGHGYRHEDIYLYPLLDDQNLNCFLGGMNYKNYKTSYIAYEQSNLIRNKSKININFHYDFQKPNTIDSRIDLNQSVFNIALSGRFQLCDHILISTLFDNTIPIIEKENWNEAFYYYLNNQELCDELRLKAYDIAKKKHTWKVRMQEFITILNKHYDTI